MKNSIKALTKNGVNFQKLTPLKVLTSPCSYFLNLMTFALFYIVNVPGVFLGGNTHF